MSSAIEYLDMSFQLLVAYDGSKESTKAIEYACEIGNAMDASITIVHAVQPNIYEAAKGEEPAMSNFADEYRREILKTIDTAEERGQDYLAEAANTANDQGQSVSTKLLYGDPVNKILEYADTDGVDMIVVGHQGQSERSDTSTGSVANALTERASVPVLITR